MVFVWWSKKELVMNYWEMGHYTNAAFYAEEVVIAEAKLNGANTIGLAASFFYLFRCYAELGELEKSRINLEQVYQLYLKHYGAEDERTKDIKSCLKNLS